MVCLMFTIIILSVHLIILNSCAGTDTLSPNRTIADGQLLVSPNRNFELGFFSPPTSTHKFLGIWYRNTPGVVVWVANRNNPISNISQGVALKVVTAGSLVITTGAESIIIWSSNSSAATTSTMMNPILRLLDTGNLVLIDNTNGADEKSYMWQSFDYPSDTRLPGMKMVYNDDVRLDKHLTSWRSYDDPSPGDFVYRIENHGLPQMVIYKDRSRVYRSGMWNGVYINVPTFYNLVYKPALVFDRDKLVSFYDPYNSSILTRLTIDQSGSLHRYTMNERRDGWNLVYTIPKDPCDDYSKCGPNGLCRVDRVPMCECLKGFKPKSRSDWDFQDWGGGCSRVTPLSCPNGDGFLEVTGVKYPAMLEFGLNTSLSLGECRDECLRRCNCAAYAQPYINNGGNGCLMWFGDLIDTRVLPGADMNQNIYIRLPVTELGKRKKSSLAKVALISVASVILISVVSCWVVFIVARRKRRAAKRKHEDLELPLFDFTTIAAATNNFSEENKIGEGGFGPVYKGQLSEDEEIAVKRLSGTSEQGFEEFKNEVILFSKLQHSNLVQLLGCYVKHDERMLIYEYMHNKSLDYLVFDENRRTHLTWPKRYGIIMGIARGLLYLHHDSRLKIIHRDMKTSNILLDETLNPKISDFGLARTFRDDQFTSRTRRVVGTFGYMAPEYAIDGKFSVKSDVFSLGVVILETVSGKKNRGFNHRDHNHNLLGHAWLLWKESKAIELMDECLNESFIESQVKRCIQVGLLCVQKLAEDRPTMSTVLFMLGCEGAVVSEPKEPGFFMERSSADIESVTSSNKDSIRETITITEVEPR